MFEKTNPQISDDQLVSELLLRDVLFVRGNQLTDTPTLSPNILLASLAESKDARVCLSLIPLLLRHPEFAPKAELVEENLETQKAKLYLCFYYTAALLFQRMYKKTLTKYLGYQSEIPDLFSTKLGVDIAQDPDMALHELAERHKVLSGQRINWIGTYRHAPDVWLRQLKLQHSILLDQLSLLHKERS